MTSRRHLKIGLIIIVKEVDSKQRNDKITMFPQKTI
jgi:hypothetical protein